MNFWKENIEMTSGDLQAKPLVLPSKEFYKKQNMVMTSGTEDLEEPFEPLKNKQDPNNPTRSVMRIALRSLLSSR